MIPNHHRAAVAESRRTKRMVGLPRGSEIAVTQAMTIVCCITVSAERRTSVAELAPTVAKLVPTVVEATERCCAGRIAGLLAEGGGRSDALIRGTCPLAAGLHSADSHDGRDDGVDFLGRSLFIWLFIAGRILADADVRRAPGRDRVAAMPKFPANQKAQEFRRGRPHAE